MARYGMALDTLTCIGCYACTLACKVANGSPTGLWWAPVVEKELGTYPAVRRLFLPLLCNHCADAPCLRACPTGAISRRDDGIVLIDQAVCCGSRGCAIACPYGAIHYYERRDDMVTPFDRAKVDRHQPGTAQKCTFCVDRLQAGQQPACVEACPTGARIFGDLEDPGSPVARALAERDSAPLGAPLNTAPSVRYLSEGVHRAGGTDADIALAYRRQRHWGSAHAVTFWLLGTGAGVFAASLWLPTGRVFLGLELGPLVAMILIAAGGMALVADLGRPLRAPRAVTNWRANWLSRGAIADALLLALLALLTLPLPAPTRPPAAALALALALFVATYPGLAMGAMGSVPAWRGPRIALGFLVEALLSGLALLCLLGARAEAAMPALFALAMIRAAVGAWHWGSAPALGRVAVLCAGIIGALAGLAVLVPSASALAGSAAVAALATGLVTKRAALRLGASPSPFGDAGELRGTARADG